MIMRFTPILLLVLAGSLAAQDKNLPSLSEDQIRNLIRQTAENDMENDKRERDYTYVQREEQHKLDGKGLIKSTEIKTSEIMELYGEQVERLISKDDKPLSDKDARKEEEKIQKVIEKRKNESEHDREKREKKEEKDASKAASSSAKSPTPTTSTWQESNRWRAVTPTSSMANRAQAMSPT